MEIVRFGRIIQGVNAHITVPIMLGGQSTTATQIVSVFTAAIQATTALDTAKAAYQQKLAAQQAAFTAAHATAAMLKSYVLGAYGKTNPIVTDFGWSIAKAAVISVKVKAGAAVKSAATRVARHTMGSKQKAAIVGTVAPAAAPAVSPGLMPTVAK